MQADSPHTFHIPVMGLGYTVDTPVKVARFGINSVISIIQDQLLEQMRHHYTLQRREPFVPIPFSDPEHRWKRVKEYLELVQQMVSEQMDKLKKESFAEGSDIMKYFRMLPDASSFRQKFDQMLTMAGEQKKKAEDVLREMIVAGSIDVNIMTKIDSPAFAKNGEPLPYEYSLAASALKGFASSTLESSVILSAGMNPRLYAYLATFPDFFPDAKGNIKKKVVLKVSDFRSAKIQGKFLAKKGIWVSEFRIESGLNCGGHAFPTDGFLLGPILEEFRKDRDSLRQELLGMCNQVLSDSGRPQLPTNIRMEVSVQGGIGTAAEDKLLREYYRMDRTGWGSPFLLVPEATNVDAETLEALNQAKPEDYYMSHASPLGVPFNNFRYSSGEANRKTRIRQNRPGSPCYLGFLAFNTEFTSRPICVSSRQYQFEKIKEINSRDLSTSEKNRLIEEIEEKDCLCEGLSASALLCNHIPVMHQLEAVTICPGPNLAYFTGNFTLQEMVDHIYGRKNILNTQKRPHFFEKELTMYMDYLESGEIKNKESYLENLNKGVQYYISLKQNLDHPGLKELPVLREVALEEAPVGKQR